MPLMRARFCELLAPVAGLAKSSNDLFLLGLLSAIDAILDMKMEDVLKEVAIRDEIRDALLGKKNPFRQVFDIAVHYEMGAWNDLEREADILGISVDAIPPMFMQAVEWARGVLSGQEVKEIATP